MLTPALLRIGGHEPKDIEKLRESIKRVQGLIENFSRMVE